MEEIARVDVAEARTKVKAGEALLVCAYEDPEKFEALHLEGAISLGEFRGRREGLEKEQSLIFYCA